MGGANVDPNILSSFLPGLLEPQLRLTYSLVLDCLGKGRGVPTLPEAEILLTLAATVRIGRCFKQFAEHGSQVHFLKRDPPQGT